MSMCRLESQVVRPPCEMAVGTELVVDLFGDDGPEFAVTLPGEDESTDMQKVQEGCGPSSVASSAASVRGVPAAAG